MAGNISQFSKALRRVAKALRASHQKRATAVASDTYALIRDRIIEKGESHTGAKFPAYSTKQAPKYYYFNRSRNNGADQRVRKLRKKTLSYAEFRRINGLQIGHVDLFFTGAMWRGTGVEVKTAVPGLVTIQIKGKTEEAREKLTWNNIRYKTNVLQPSTGELAFARRSYAFLTNQVIKNALTAK